MAILISTPQDLNNIRNNLSGDYELTNDIDMSSFGNFTPIGNYTTKFKGSLDGKGFKIKNLTINISSQNVGLFGCTENATISNVGIENANVTSNMQNYVGIVVGYTFGTTSISNSYTTGQVNGQYGIGGLVGYGDAIINNCYSNATITGKGRVGGLVGNLNVNSGIDKSYSTGLVTVTPDPNLYNGGLVGSVAGTPSITNSYWDINTSGQTISAGGTGLTTSEMKTQSSYNNWDFISTWGINGDYPYLQVFGVPTAPPKTETVSVDSYSLPLYSNLSKSSQSTKQLQSFVNAIENSQMSKLSVLREVSTYLSQIKTNAVSYKLAVMNGTREINSFVYPIGSYVTKKSKTIQQLLSYVKPIQSNISVLYPLRDIPVYAYSKVIQNPSSVLEVTNNNQIFCIHNPSSNSKVMNYSEVRMIQNPSEVEVI